MVFRWLFKCFSFSPKNFNLLKFYPKIYPFFTHKHWIYRRIFVCCILGFKNLEFFTLFCIFKHWICWNILNFFILYIEFSWILDFFYISAPYGSFLIFHPLIPRDSFRSLLMYRFSPSPGQCECSIAHLLPHSTALASSRLLYFSFTMLAAWKND